MRKLKIGVLGGTRGFDFLTRVLCKHPLAEVTAICENFPKLKLKVEEDAKKYSDNIRVFSDFDAFITSGIDAVVIANFANAHAPYAIKALKQGIHVFSESIPTQTMKEAIELYEAVEQSGKIYAYGENYCYLPHMLEIRKIYETGELGELMHTEGNFLNDCSFDWHKLTRGNRNHWRNYVASTFYCTHSIGPMLYVTGRKAETVVGMETQRMPYLAEQGARSASAAMEIMQLDNGAMAKSINGNYRRSFSPEYRFVSENGTIETDIYNFGDIRIYRADKQIGGYKEEIIKPPYTFDQIPVYSYKDLGTMQPFEIADVNSINTFIQAILGNPDAKKYMIDVYQALNMSIVGTLAYRSILSGSNAIKIPDLKRKEDRDLWRNDNHSTDASISFGDDLLPSCKDGFIDVDDAVYEKVFERFNNTPLKTGMQ